MDRNDGTLTESFAAYLARALIAKKGFWQGTVPEAHELFEHCNEVVTRTNGLTLEIIGIVDRSSDPSRPLGLTKEALDRIGKECLRYSGKAGFRKLPVTIAIIETARGPVPAQELERLKLLKNRSPFSTVLLSAWICDETAKTLWTNTPVRGRFSMRPFLDGLLIKTRLTEEELTPKAPAVLPGRRPLYLTYCLLALIAAVFIGEYIFRLSPSSGMLDPSIETLIALGALDKSLVMKGEWWRLFSGPLLHGGLIHIALNGIALFFAGAVLENVVGRAWFAAIFAVSGIAGAAMSLLINPPELISVGASGAIMGLFAAAFAVSYRFPLASPMRTFLQSGSLRVLIPSLIPLFDGLFGQKIDFAAHIGGAIGGAVTGAFLAASWQKQDLLPPYRKLAWVLAAAILGGTLYGGAEVAKGYDKNNLVTYLIPPEQLPNDTATGKARSAQLVASYPRDPRSHMYRALSFMDAGNSAAAEREWKGALDDEAMLRLFFKPQLEDFIRASLAFTLKDNGKQAEARNAARPVCGTKGEVRDELAKEGLCE